MLNFEESNSTIIIDYEISIGPDLTHEKKNSNSERLIIIQIN